ncbi:RidA family protein [Criibacterium bergeronii]|uniref:RidA family protein n=1 Tax=Criibacterium bergeronii TaxID=1871336 RepID=A0A371IPB5_9FIRM|nr:RidA family protein [Criibacterium bergeronii]MBS6063201.1 RidA family protein [Peptostreptococcaceae bacterium]RDY22332.1 RidA family protein [Criibacterium bergeronii]
MKKIISTPNAPAAIGPYSQATATDSLIFTSGQLPIDPKTGELVTEIKAATKQSLENCKAILEQEGSSLDNALKVTVYMRDINDFAAMNEVYGEYFKQNSPARSAFQVAALPKNGIVEIEVIATK